MGNVDFSVANVSTMRYVYVMARERMLATFIPIQPWSALKNI